MKTPGRNRLTKPTSCLVSDLLNSIQRFTDDNPFWWEDAESVKKMLLAYTALKNICDPSMVTEAEYEMVMCVHRNIERTNQ